MHEINLLAVRFNQTWRKLLNLPEPPLHPLEVQDLINALSVSTFNMRDVICVTYDDLEPHEPEQQE